MIKAEVVNRKILCFQTLRQIGLLSLLYGGIALAQVKQTWDARYSSGSSINEGRAVALDQAGNVYVTGFGYGGTANSYHFVTIKYNDAGVEQWVRQYQGPGNSYAYAIAVDQQSNVYVTGSSVNASDDFDCVTIKYNSNGVQQWLQRYNSRPGYDDRAIAMAFDSAGNIFVVGRSDTSGSEQWLMLKYNSAGSLQWARQYSPAGATISFANAVAADSQGNIYVTGSVFRPGPAEDCATVSYDANGTLRWEQFYNGSGGTSGEAGKDVAIDGSGNVYVSVYSLGAVTIKYSPTGVQQWMRQHIVAGPSTSGRQALAIDRAGNLYVMATFSDANFRTDFGILKYNVSGTLQWVRQYNGVGNGYDTPTAIAVDDESGVYLTGLSAVGSSSANLPDYATVKYDSSGNFKWVQHYSGPVNGSYETGWDIVVDRRSSVYVTGVSSAQAGYVCATVKYTQEQPLSFSRPRPGERWLGGNVDTIRWTGGRANQFVDIHLSTDSGATYTTIDYAIPADSGKYIWLVPDSLTTRAKIRLLDTATNDTLAVSDTFKIKRYSLTRINRFGQYEEFSPVKHGWSFANADSNYWPPTWWRQIDYLTGIDRHTGDPYDPMFGENPVNALPFHFVDWPVFVDVFGRSACYWFFTDSYREASVDRWKGVKTRWNGSCFGVAQSALLYFHYRDQFRQRHPSVPLTDSLASVAAMTDSIRLIINRYFAMQFGKLKRDHDINNLGTTPRQTLQAVRQMWINDNPDDDAGLRFVDPAGSGGHAVIPFRLQRRQTNPNQFWLFVCNSNNPQSMNDAILIDSLADTWQEFTGFGWVQGMMLMYLYPPAVSFLAPSVFPSGATFSGFNEANIAGGGRLEFGVPYRSDVRMFASNGDSIGVSGGNAFNSIQGATPITLDTGYPQPPLAYDLPSGAYKIRLTNPTDSVIVVSSRADSLSITYSRRGATQGQRDEFWYNGALGVKNLDAAQKAFNLQILTNGESNDRTTNIDGLAIGQNDSVSAGVDVLARPKLTNFGQAKSYQLQLRHSSGQGLRRFESATLNVPAQSAHIIAPRWDSLTTVRIYVDLGNNGTIDDTLIVNNTLDVEDRGDLGVPQEYHLAQNYPNPFNPTTTIKYQIPSISHVTLKVFDILGREVATVVDGVQGAGYKAVQFDATNLASGVFFYRLTTGNYVATRKFIVAK